MSEKETIWRRIRDVSTYDLEGSIDHVIELLQAYKTENPNKVLRLEVVSDSYEDGNHLQLQYMDIETDDEFKARMEKEANQKMLEEKWEREKLAMLKAKYEGGK